VTAAARVDRRFQGFVGVRVGRVRALPLRGRIVLAILVLIAVIGALGPLITPYPPNAIAVGPISAPPSWSHPFGTDEYGRDELSRVMVAARVSLIAGTSAPVAALLLGGTLGAVAASSRRWIDELIMRVMDIQLAFPSVVLALVFAEVLGPGLATTIIVMAIIYSAIMARLVRANVMTQLGEDYVAAERALGSSTRRILLRHVSINIATPTLVFLTLVAADAVSLQAALSFLGASVRPPTASWGSLVYDGSQQMLAGSWWLTVFPGLAILITVLSLNTLSESIADRIGGRDYLLAGR
jgi:peptide/nickel transport system permease protein